MVRELDGKVVVDRGVDQPEAMTLVGLQLDAVVLATAQRVDVRAIEEDIIAEGGRLGPGDQLALEGLGIAVIPVSDGEDAEIFLIRQGGRAFDDDATGEAVGVLRGVVGVIPGARASDLSVVFVRCTPTMRYHIVRRANDTSWLSLAGWDIR